MDSHPIIIQQRTTSLHYFITALCYSTAELISWHWRLWFLHPYHPVKRISAMWPYGRKLRKMCNALSWLWHREKNKKMDLGSIIVYMRLFTEKNQCALKLLSAFAFFCNSFIPSNGYLYNKTDKTFGFRRIHSFAQGYYLVVKCSYIFPYICNFGA